MPLPTDKSLRTTIASVVRGHKTNSGHHVLCNFGPDKPVNCKQCSDMIALDILDALAANGYVIVPKVPSPGLLMSMALRSDHGLGCPEYYDQEMFGAKLYPMTHADMVESAITQMRQLHEEVVGTGFYDVTKEDEYRTFMTVDKPEQSATLEK